MVDLIWKPINKPELGVYNRISEAIKQKEWMQPELLTSVREGSTLFIASDYSGSHKGSKYEALSFLLADLEYCGLWEEQRIAIRERYLKDDRKMSFKNLNDVRRRRALIPFLASANTMHGLLITFVVHKNILSSISEGKPKKSEESQVGELSKWKDSSFFKLSRIAHLGSLLIACMSSIHQNIIWISDYDEISPNKEKLIEATKIIGHYLNHYLSHDIGHFRFGTTESDKGNMELKDLIALPDLAAGALAEFFSKNLDSYGMPLGKVLKPIEKSTKTNIILNWIANKQYPLSKLILSIEENYSVHILDAVNN